MWIVTRLLQGSYQRLAVVSELQRSVTDLTSRVLVLEEDRVKRKLEHEMQVVELQRLIASLRTQIQRHNGTMKGADHDLLDFKRGRI